MKIALPILLLAILAQAVVITIQSNTDRIHRGRVMKVKTMDGEMVVIFNGEQILEVSRFASDAVTEAATKAAQTAMNYPDASTNFWLGYFEIWKCGDGTFEVKSGNGLKGKFSSLPEAKDFHYSEAVRMAEYMTRQHSNNIVEPFRGPDCGIRIK